MNTGIENHFDRQLRLHELFSNQEIARLQEAISRLLNCSVEIVASDAPGNPGWRRLAINWEFEPIGYIESDNAGEEQLQGVVGLLLILVKDAVRYRMVSDLHLESAAADFEALQTKHTELRKSEKQYRELSEHLEQKVAAQVMNLEAAQTKIYQSEKLASIGQLAAGVAHELNSPLAYIQNNLVTAKDYLRDLHSYFELFQQGAEPARLQEVWQEVDIDYILGDFPVLLDASLEGVKKAASIVADLKIFSNINQQEKRLENINEQLKTVVKMIAPQVDGGIEISFDCAELPLTLCYPAHLGQVFYNLIQNGVQAIKGEGRVHITTSVLDDNILISVTDSGVGIDEANLSRIFDPFFTTKEVGSGTGLGLSVTHDILKAHEGRIEVQSTLGSGTTFTVILPVRSDLIDQEADF
jgi:signal transduction histidine kinase